MSTAQCAALDVDNFDPAKEITLSRILNVFLTLASIGFLAIVAVLYIGYDTSERDMLFQSSTLAADSLQKVEIEYVGSKKCRLCHTDIYNSWLKSPHASASGQLTEMRLHDTECAECHTTGHARDRDLLENVGCEACHGPGSEYRKMRVMKDEQRAHELGLRVQSEMVCIRCHNDRCQHFDGFDYIQSFLDEDAVHVFPHRNDTVAP